MTVIPPGFRELYPTTAWFSVDGGPKNYMWMARSAYYDVDTKQDITGNALWISVGAYGDAASDLGDNMCAADTWPLSTTGNPKGKIVVSDIGWYVVCALVMAQHIYPPMEKAGFAGFVVVQIVGCPEWFV